MACPLCFEIIKNIIRIPTKLLTYKVLVINIKMFNVANRKNKYVVISFLFYIYSKRDKKYIKWYKYISFCCKFLSIVNKLLEFYVHCTTKIPFVLILFSKIKQLNKDAFNTKICEKTASKVDVLYSLCDSIFCHSVLYAIAIYNIIYMPLILYWI